MKPGADAEWSGLAPVAGSGSIGSPGGTHPIAATGDVLHAVYAQHGRVYYRRSTDGAKTWGEVVLVVDSGTAQYPCSLETTGTALHLIWPDSRSDGDSPAEAVGGSGTWAIVLIRHQDSLWYRRRDVR